MGKCEQKNIDFPAALKDWNKFEQDNKTIALNILFVPYNTKQISRAHISKYNYERDNQVILLMITDGKKWHYLALKSLPTFNEKRKKNIILLEKVHRDYLEEYHRIIMGTFIV